MSEDTGIIKDGEVKADHTPCQCGKQECCHDQPKDGSLMMVAQETCCISMGKPTAPAEEECPACRCTCGH
jgi:hypothetical protein